MSRCPLLPSSISRAILLFTRQCPSTVRSVFPMLVFQPSEQRNHTQTTPSTVLRTTPNHARTITSPSRRTLRPHLLLSKTQAFSLIESKQPKKTQNTWTFIWHPSRDNRPRHEPVGQPSQGRTHGTTVPGTNTTCLRDKWRFDWCNSTVRHSLRGSLLKGGYNSSLHAPLAVPTPAPTLSLTPFFSLATQAPPPYPPSPPPTQAPNRNTQANALATPGANYPPLV